VIGTPTCAGKSFPGINISGKSILHLFFAFNSFLPHDGTHDADLIVKNASLSNASIRPSFTLGIVQKRLNAS